MGGGGNKAQAATQSHSRQKIILRGKISLLSPDEEGAKVHREGDGESVCGGATVCRQPSHGQPGEFAGVQGQYRFQVFTSETQEVYLRPRWMAKGTDGCLSKKKHPREYFITEFFYFLCIPPPYIQ